MNALIDFHNAEAGALYSVGWNAYGQCGTGVWYMALCVGVVMTHGQPFTCGGFMK
jgi:alpha-tubulin suppressor-like RCC1 family protein